MSYKPTLQTFLPLLMKNEEKIRSVRSQTFQFGTHPRHKLDVYFPNDSESFVEDSRRTKKYPILLFTYGGIFVSGSRILKGTSDLIYANIGAFFAMHGYLTVIADYRLAPEGTYPSGIEDHVEALLWIIANLSSLGDTSRIFLLSHSAGATHQTCTLLHPTMLTPDIRSRIRGAIFMGGGYHIATRPGEIMSSDFEFISRAVAAYFQDNSLVPPTGPYGLLISATSSHIQALPPMMFIAAEHEPQFYKSSKDEFVRLLRDKGAKDVMDIVNPRHNHLSAPFSLSSGEGEEWGYEVLRWMSDRLQDPIRYKL